MLQAIFIVTIIINVVAFNISKSVQKESYSEHLEITKLKCDEDEDYFKEKYKY